MSTSPATLPERYDLRTLADLGVGEVAYVTPWSMDVCADRTCWLDLHAIPHHQSMGTASMKVQYRPDGWHVWLTDWFDFSTTYRTDPARRTDNDRYAPVAKIHE